MARPRVATHGDPSMYTNHNCRCELCVIAWNAYIQGRNSVKPTRKNGPSNVKSRRTVDAEAEKALREGVCDCCGEIAVRGLVFDHDHARDLFRGFLCYSCNTGIGKLGDTIEGLTKALNYLKRFDNSHPVWDN